MSNKIIRNCIYRFYDDKALFTCPLINFYKEIRAFIDAFVNTSDISSLSSKIVNSFCNRCVICYQRVNVFGFTICELCVHTCINLKTCVWIDIMRSFDHIESYYLDCPYKYTNNGITYQQLDPEHSYGIERRFVSPNGKIVTETLYSERCAVHEYYEICESLARCNNIYPRYLTVQLSSNAHKLYNRYYKIPILMFLSGWIDKESMINMLPRDIIMTIFSFIY